MATMNRNGPDGRDALMDRMGEMAVPRAQLPEQWAKKDETMRALMPEYRMVAAILEDAIHSIFVQRGNQRRETVRQDALAWVRTEGHMGAGVRTCWTFDEVCSLMGLDPVATRAAIIKRVAIGTRTKRRTRTGSHEPRFVRALVPLGTR